ncbi:MAG TPA: xylose isomerase [Bacillaceae bacterium]|nr:xylose isomerase [Paenibacillus bovis]HLU23821.1 xylose isomerase [Bacillaceae bacterium]
MLKEAVFKDIPVIKYEGSSSTNPFAFKHYNADEIVGDKPMKDHLRFAMSYWHTFTFGGTDPFGLPTMEREWDSIENPMELAKRRVVAAFEFMEKLGIEYFCFHDVDVAPEGKTLAESERNLFEIVDLIEEKMEETGIKLLWGTTNAFSNRVFMHGAATSSNADVFARTAAQIKIAMDITKRLGGENYVLWGGREGYETLLNTNTELELDNLARLLKMVAAYKKEIGFTGQLLIEPKPKEPTKHQYDFDTATVLGFLRKYGLENDYKLNIEANHATLAGHTFQHELNMARINGALGSIDANQGDTLLGWDTDQFPTNVYDATLAMYEVLKQGGLAPGGLNFDAKVRRASFEAEDLFHAYIAGMDTFAKGLKVAHKLLEDGVLEDNIAKRYETYDNGIGKEIVNEQVGLNDLYEYAIRNNDIKLSSGRQEMLEAIVNNYIYETK